MFYHSISHSKGGLTAEIVEGQQEIEGETWTSETERIGKKYNIDTDMIRIKETKKSEWKNDNGKF